jgi:hypothetical protein
MNGGTRCLPIFRDPLGGAFVPFRGQRVLLFPSEDPIQNGSRHPKRDPFEPGWHFGEEYLKEMPKISPAEATGGILVRSRDAKWKSG